MNLSKRGEYAVRVLLDLAMAGAEGVGLVPLTVLAEAQRIPAPFLEQILLNLRQAGFLSSTRGKYGGYSLAKPAAEIGMGELIRYLDGPLVTTGCVLSTSPHKCSCPDQEHCGLRVLMGRVQTALSGVLDGLSLQELAQTTLLGYRQSGVIPTILIQLREAVTSEKKGRRRRGGGDSEPEYLI